MKNQGRNSPSKPDIPFNRASLTGRELEYMATAVQGGHISGDGPFTRKCNSYLEQLLGVPKVLLTTSGTASLEMIALLLEVGTGDEVIVPSFTFVSTANAFALRGAKLVFADVTPDTFNIDVCSIERLLTPRTKAIVAVHYAGVGCEMDRILEIGSRHGIAVVEDNAHGLFGKFRGRWLGSLGCMAAQSFHETKNITCGEGGALIVTDPRFIERAEIVREKGTDRSRFFRGQVDKYTWIDAGSSFLPSDLLAAFLWAQLESWQTIQAKRCTIWQRYLSELSAWAEREGVGLPVVPGTCQHPYHMFYMLLPSLEVRTRLITFLRQAGILSVFHYLPLHLSEMGRKYGGAQGDCPVSEDVSNRLLRLPFYTELSETEQWRVIDSVRGFSC